MSEDSVPYAPAAPIECDEASCRTALRSIKHWIDGSREQMASEDSLRRLLDMIRDRATSTLNKPRSNGIVIDQLEREVAELRGKLLEADVLRRAHRGLATGLPVQIPRDHAGIDIMYPRKKSNGIWSRIFGGRRR